jgi:hypothetical protein
MRAKWAWLCAAVAAGGVESRRRPPRAGVETLSGQISIVTAATTGAASGSVGGAEAAQLFQFSADPGKDCVATPVTGLTVSAQGVSLGTGGH